MLKEFEFQICFSIHPKSQPARSEALGFAKFFVVFVQPQFIISSGTPWDLPEFSSESCRSEIVIVIVKSQFFCWRVRRKKSIQEILFFSLRGGFLTAKQNNWCFPLFQLKVSFSYFLLIGAFKLNYTEKEGKNNFSVKIIIATEKKCARLNAELLMMV